MIRYAHTNLIAKDWRKLSSFYETVFGCVPILPERDLSGDWLDKGTGLKDAHIRGAHLRLPGYDLEGPTLEIFEYEEMPEKRMVRPNTPGFSHIAFSVNDVSGVAEQVFKYDGSAVGDLVVKEVDGVGRLAFQYVADPEGNIIELQKWDSLGS